MGMMKAGQQGPVPQGHRGPHTEFVSFSSLRGLTGPDPHFYKSPWPAQRGTVWWRQEWKTGYHLAQSNSGLGHVSSWIRVRG